MPNWCSNSGHIKGEPTVIKTLWDIIHAGSMESDGHDARPAITALRPCPPDLTGTMSGFMSEENEEYAEWVKQQESNKEKYGYADWYGWCVDNWGTKWTPDFSFEMSSCGTTISFQGDSAWSPPEELMRYITETYPVMVEMSYIEESMGFVGCSIFHKGNTYCSSSEPEIDYDSYTDKDGEIDWQEYYDSMDKVRSEHETLAYAKFEMDDAEPAPTVLLGRDILPRIGEASVTTTLTGEVIVSMDTPESGKEVTE
jgi:hypothetical protein